MQNQMHNLGPVTDEPLPTPAEMFAAHYGRMVRLAGLLGADDPEDLAQEAFARLYRKKSTLRDPRSAVAYVRATVCNLARNRSRHLRMARLRAPHPPDHHAAAEQTAIVAENHRELLAALESLPARQREALVLRYWLDLSEQEIAHTMRVSPGTVKTHTSRGMATLSRKLEEKQS